MTHFGYACISELTGLTTNHSCQLKSATPERLRGLIEQNLNDLQRILQHNVENGWRLFRIGSGTIPFASHPVNQLHWWREFALALTGLGKFARANDLRLSMHPGQYTVLSSPTPHIRKNSRAELVYAARLLDVMDLDARHKIVLHLGGAYDDKAAAIARFNAEIEKLPEYVRARLVLEHDERIYNASEVLRVAQNHRLPMIFDNLHHAANPSPQSLDELLPRVFATWRERDGKPKVHFSSQARGERRGKHAHFASSAEFARWLSIWQRAGDFDVMLEAKGKDAALKRLLKDTARRARA